MSRKVNAFSKDHDFLEHQLSLAFAYYHFVIPHLGLRQKLAMLIPTNGTGSKKRWVQRTPAKVALLGAMAALLTESGPPRGHHIWSMDELLSKWPAAGPFRVPPKHLWAI